MEKEPQLPLIFHHWGRPIRSMNEIRGETLNEIRGETQIPGPSPFPSPWPGRPRDEQHSSYLGIFNSPRTNVYKAVQEPKASMAAWFLRWESQRLAFTWWREEAVTVSGAVAMWSLLGAGAHSATPCCSEGSLMAVLDGFLQPFHCDDHGDETVLPL